MKKHILTVLAAILSVSLLSSCSEKPNDNLESESTLLESSNSITQSTSKNEGTTEEVTSASTDKLDTTIQATEETESSVITESSTQETETPSDTEKEPAPDTSKITETTVTDTESQAETETEPHKHTPTTAQEVEPTFSESGKTEGSFCSGCGEILKKQEIIPSHKTQAEKLIIGCWEWAHESFEEAEYEGDRDMWYCSWGNFTFTANGEFSTYSMGGFEDPDDTDKSRPEDYFVYNGHYYSGAMGAGGVGGKYEIIDADAERIVISVIQEYAEGPEDPEEPSEIKYQITLEIIDENTLKILKTEENSGYAGPRPHDDILNKSK